MNNNPFRGMSHKELVMSYLIFSAMEDIEAVHMVSDAFDADVYIDLREFGISTTDFQ